MFSSVRSFLYRHRRKFVVSGVLVASAFVLSKYVRKCITDWHEKQAKEFLERRQKQQHYESVERTCNQAALTLIPSIKESVCGINNTEELIKNAKLAGNKVASFEELKFLAFSKVTLLIYMSSLLIVTLRLQLNLIGGYMFKSTIDENAIAINSNIQEKYLSLSQHLIKTGVRKLSDLIREKVEIVLKNRSLKEKLTLKDMEQIFWSIHAAIDKDPFNPCHNLSSYILPPQDNTIAEPDLSIYQKIITETSDLLESEEVMSLTNSCVSRGFSYFVDSLTQYFVNSGKNSDVKKWETTPSTSNQDPFFQENQDTLEIAPLTYISMPMAKVIPIINGSVSNRNTTIDTSSTWIQQLILMDNLKDLGANVYECFCA